MSQSAVSEVMIETRQPINMLFRVLRNGIRSAQGQLSLEQCDDQKFNG
jgi:hypothetical protein